MSVWLPIPNWPYEVSDAGEVRRIGAAKVLVPMWTGQKRKQYATVRLCNSDKQKDFKVHRLVCELFHGPPPKGAIACHRNDDPKDNSAINLYWGTWQSNARDLGSRRPTAQVVADIRRRRAAGERGSALAIEYGVSQQLICDIVKGRSYSYV